MTVCAYFSSFLKDEKSFVSLSVRGETILSATADGKGNLVGRCEREGRVKDAVFALTRFDCGLPETGAVKLSDGEISSAFCEFFEASEQRLARAVLGERFQRGAFLCAGGIFLEALPGAKEEVFRKIAEKLPSKEELCALFEEKDPLRELFGGEILFEREIRFHCRCSRRKAALAVISLGKEDALALQRERGALEVCCPECGRNYSFSQEQIMELFKQNG